MLLAVPNVSEGRDADAIAAIGGAFGSGGVRVLDVHSDPDHNRSVFTLAGDPGALAPALLAGARVTLDRVDLNEHEGVHPHVGAVDVVPVVHLDAGERGAACAEALVAGELIGELGVPVLLYGALAGGRTRADLRRGGLPELARRLAAGDLEPDFGPSDPDPARGATLVAARPPLVAFNLDLASEATVEEAREAAAAVREGGSEGLPGVRALGLWLESRAMAQISLNVEDPAATPLADVVAGVRRHAAVREAELVGLAPAVAFAGFPDDLEVRGFDPQRHLIENALAGD